MNGTPLRSIGILGGGPFGWMAAAALAQALAPLRLDIVVVDDASEAGLQPTGAFPPLRALNRSLGITDGDLVRYADATFRLGIAYGTAPNRIIVGFDALAGEADGIPAHQHWLRSPDLYPLDALSPAAVAAGLGRVDPSGAWPQGLGWLSVGLHLDLAGYARLLRQAAEDRGVRRIAGKPTAIDAGDGRVRSVRVAGASPLAPDLWIDTRGDLIARMPGAAWPERDSSAPSPDRAPVRVERSGPPALLTTVARTAGRWRATMSLGAGDLHLAGESARETGHRPRAFAGNVLAIGAAMTSMGAWEGVGLQLAQNALARLVTCLPDQSCGPEIDHLDAIACAEADRASDFLRLVSRADPPAEQDDELARKIALFTATARLSTLDHELLLPSAWVSALIGQGYSPRTPGALAGLLPEAATTAHLRATAAAVQAAAARLPTHADALAAAAASARR